MKKLLRINSGHVRQGEHRGTICTDIRLLVDVTDETRDHNGTELVQVIDSTKEAHWVDPWFLEEIPLTIKVGQLKLNTTFTVVEHYRHTDRTYTVVSHDDRVKVARCKDHSLNMTLVDVSQDADAVPLV